MPTSSRGRELGREDRHRRERVADLAQVLGLDRPPLGEPRIRRPRREQAVRDHRVDVVPEQRQVGERATGFGDHESLGVDHQPRARDLAVGQQLAHAVEAGREPRDGVEHLVGRDRDAHHPGEERPDRPRDRRAGPGRRGPCTNRSRRGARAAAASRPSARSRRRRRRTSPHVGEGLDVGEGEDLVEARDDRELLGLDRVGAGPVEEGDEVLAHRVPRRLEPGPGVELDAVQPRRDRRRRRRRAATSNASASEWAGSVEHTTVRSPASAARSAVAAATVVLPTPPLPVNRRIRRGSRLPRSPSRSISFFSSRRAVPMIIPARPPLDEARERRREVDGELVVHLRAVAVGLEAVRAVEPAEHVALDELPRERPPARRSSRTATCSGSSCRGPRRGTRPATPARRRRGSRIVACFTSRAHSGYRSKSTTTS